MSENVTNTTAFSVDKTTSTATAKGTKIVKPGNEMDKNAFLRILSAELSNQDPENTKDSTQYVAQMAQFASLEQMTNLNSSMTLMGASSLIGRSVKLNAVDDSGVQYVGTVMGAVKDGSSIKLNIEVNENGKKVTKEFPYEDVLEIE